MSIFLRLMDSELLILIENGWGWEQVCLKKEKKKKGKKINQNVAKKH